MLVKAALAIAFVCLAVPTRGLHSLAAAAAARSREPQLAAAAARGSKSRVVFDGKKVDLLLRSELQLLAMKLGIVPILNDNDIIKKSIVLHGGDYPYTTSKRHKKVYSKAAGRDPVVEFLCSLSHQTLKEFLDKNALIDFIWLREILIKDIESLRQTLIIELGLVSRRQLQQIAKENKIRANMSSNVIKNSLVDLVRYSYRGEKTIPPAKPVMHLSNDKLIPSLLLKTSYMSALNMRDDSEDNAASDYIARMLREQRRTWRTTEDYVEHRETLKKKIGLLSRRQLQQLAKQNYISAKGFSYVIICELVDIECRDY